MLANNRLSSLWNARHCISSAIALGLLWGSSTLVAQERAVEMKGEPTAAQVKDWLDDLSATQRQRLQDLMRDDHVANYPAEVVSKTVQQAPDHQNQCCSQLANAQQQITAYQKQVELLKEKVASLEKGCRK